MRYNAVFQLGENNVTIVGIPHMPNIGIVQLLPDNSGRCGVCVSVERDNKHACLREYPYGELIEFSGYGI